MNNALCVINESCSVDDSISPTPHRRRCRCRCRRHRRRVVARRCCRCRCSLRVLRVLRVLCVCCGRVLRVLRVLCVLRVLRVALRTAWRATRATDRSLAVRACGLRPTSGCRRGRLSRSPHFGTLEIPLDFVARCFALLWN